MQHQARPDSQGFFEILGFTWSFRGRYKWGYKSPNMGSKYSYPVTLLITLLITTHEPASRVCALVFRL